ncbi:beta-mannosidase [Amphibacillus sp. Q70]|uniref:beta-mannosidase n=1 Tax=Amphibacillus sp. Q70 TaxID=3453416 RepID=UPI003F8481D4
MKQIMLNGPWLFRESKKDQWLEAQVPGSILADLYRLNKIDNPFYRDNEAKLFSLFKTDYLYKKTFAISHEILNESFIYLNFSGIDTIATIYINDQQISHVKNMHRSYRYDIKKYLKKGKNEISILLHSPLAYVNEKNRKKPLYGNSESTPGLTQIRKAQYMFGWDWGPTLPDLGIWREVYIEAYSEAKIDSVHVLQKHSNDRVKLQFTFEIENFKADQLSMELQLLSPLGESTTQKFILSTQREYEMIINKPELWWPNGMGEQNLYHLTCTLIKDEQILDETKLTIGLRELTVITDEDKWGEQFAFEINKKKIFAMGANYIPEDNLLSCAGKEKTKSLIEGCAAANFNMIRVWGGGYYPDSDFYQLCDQYGLIVWQDLMFACGVYPVEEKEFIAEVKKETFDNLKRIRHHASLGLICGNNEIEMFFDDGRIPATIENKKQYQTFFEENMTEWVQELAPNTFYWPSSPSSGHIFKDTNGENSGDGHNWDVWHGESPIISYQNTYNRFMSEFGFQSFPTMQTIESFTEANDRNLFSHVMESHQKNQQGNMKIFTYLAQHYLFPKDLSSFIYLSQLLQAKAIKTGVEHWRQNRGRCMGSLYWQLNDCWPAPSWSSIDYFGRWKALHYVAKKFYQPILLSVKEQDNKVEFFLTNDSLNDVRGTIEWQLLKKDGEIIRSGKFDTDIQSLNVKKVSEIDFNTELKDSEIKKETVLYYHFTNHNHRDNYGTLLFTPLKYFQLKQPELHFDLKENEKEFALIISGNSFAKHVEVTLLGEDVVYSDNYFDIIPNVPYEITLPKAQLKKEYTKETLKEIITLRSVFDTYE